MCAVRSHRALALKGWLDLQQYYISALKNGVYPSILRDRVFLWARLHPANTDAPKDVIGRPSGWQYVGSPSLSRSLSGSPDTSTRTDRGLPLGYDLFHRRERLRHVAVWRLLRNDCVIWHWGVQTANAVNGRWWSDIGYTTEGWCRCCKPRSGRICILQPPDVIQLQCLCRILALTIPHDARMFTRPRPSIQSAFARIETTSTL